MLLLLWFEVAVTDKRVHVFLIYVKDFNSLQQFYRSLIIQLCRKGKTAIVKVGKNEKECLAGSKPTAKLSPRHSLIPPEWEPYSQDTREVKLCLSSGVNWYRTSVCGWGFDLQYVLITAYIEFFFAQSCSFIAQERSISLRINVVSDVSPQIL